MGVDTVRCYDTGMAISYHRGRWRKMSGLHPDTWNPLENLELNHFWHLIDRMGEKIPFDRPWDFPEAAEWDSMTVKEWAEKTFWFQLTRDVLYVHCSAEFCAEAKDLSLLYFLWYIKEGGGYMRMSATDNGAQERKFIGGSQRICLNIAEHLGKGNVLLSKPVSSIEQDADGVKVTTITGDSYKAKYIITALPPAMLCKIKFTPSLPALRNQLNQRYPMGSVIKTMMYYKRPFWRDQNFSCNIYADGIISATQDDCSEGSNAIIGFMTGDSAREHCHLTKEER
ncbi:amine oxidase [flavin-containing] B-like [Lytechinus pictus]|uniref:amine oxidase [flavin-containing] B-like n=1 Tax=Lytechinus pictus TaxID=7653 RepID=UPI0030BA2220